MPAVSFSDAAAHLGHASRSQLYRMRHDGRLDDYLRPGGRNGAQLLELMPPGRPNLRQHVAEVTKFQFKAENHRSRVDRRWHEVAAALSEESLREGGPNITAEEAERIAEALPAAMAAAFGWSGTAKLREWLEEVEEELPAPARGHPAEKDAPDPGDLSFLRERGRQVKEIPAGIAFWDEVAAWINVFTVTRRGPSNSHWPDARDALTGSDIDDIHDQIDDAIAAVERGILFDLDRFDRAELLDHYLPEVEGANAEGEASGDADELRLLLEAGRVPEDLRSRVEAALGERARFS